MALLWSTAIGVTTFYYQIQGTDAVSPSLINDPSILSNVASSLHKALGSPAALLVSDINIVVISGARRRRLLAPVPVVLAIQIANLTPEQATNITAVMTDPKFTGTFSQQLVSAGFTSAWSVTRSDQAGTPLEPTLPIAGESDHPGVVGAAACEVIVEISLCLPPSLPPQLGVACPVLLSLLFSAVPAAWLSAMSSA
jgi:hypothetical protein